jgi:hypothetical protein
MEKLIVRDAFSDGCQQRLFVSPVNINLSTKHEFIIYRQQPILNKGDIIKIYNDKNSSKYGYCASMVHSYKTDNKRYIDFLSPKYHDNIYSKLNIIDAVYLYFDVLEYLRQNNIKPTLNKNTNLRLLLQHQQQHIR